MLVVIAEFKNYHKSDKLHSGIIEMNQLEEMGDKCFINAVYNLYGDNKISAEEKMSWENVFYYMEKCCDACEHTADIIENITMKYN
jgi:uncharacterized protein Yka (UPF0111/DUF47 family)